MKILRIKRISYKKDAKTIKKCDGVEKKSIGSVDVKIIQSENYNEVFVEKIRGNWNISMMGDLKEIKQIYKNNEKTLIDLKKAIDFMENFHKQK